MNNGTKYSPSLKIYLAARYSRRLELCEYRTEVESIPGVKVSSRWLNGTHQISNDGTPIGENGEKLIEGDDGSADVRSAELRERFALEDAEDVRNSEILIAFTQPPRTNASRGGRHVELGMALALGKIVYVVGHRENIFCWLPQVTYFETWQECLNSLKENPPFVPESPTCPTSFGW